MLGGTLISVNASNNPAYGPTHMPVFSFACYLLESTCVSDNILCQHGKYSYVVPNCVIFGMYLRHARQISIERY